MAGTPDVDRPRCGNKEYQILGIFLKALTTHQQMPSNAEIATMVGSDEGHVRRVIANVRQTYGQTIRADGRNGIRRRIAVRKNDPEMRTNPKKSSP